MSFSTVQQATEDLAALARKHDLVPAIQYLDDTQEQEQQKENQLLDQGIMAAATTTVRAGTPVCCLGCGAVVGLEEHTRKADEAQRRIAELEAQVKILSDKASAAGILLLPVMVGIVGKLIGFNVCLVDKLADYEDELQKLKRKQNSSPPGSLSTPPSTTVTSSPTHRLSSFLSITTRRGAGPPSPPIDPDSRPSSSAGVPSTAELEKALSEQKRLRKQAEGRLQQVTNELEELSASLFQQANQMVADERRARSKLEERVALLEKREKEKTARLGQLEVAVGRINRVKGLLIQEEEARGARGGSGFDSSRGSVSSQAGSPTLPLPMQDARAHVSLSA